ncbi:hypothetical protein MVES1_001791 [Malassezia vespertilionis]|uniref:Uncharacterized protein n=1 Tax=Malassezia vespertilionis TaxID=2020962 RepID=A0A2N1JDG7_9BASI|nr:uncharacterized protein MVES1_001791 [Malassezia vespertilionis]PKI84572.1 hypothetical protein MVES_001691 [Malassezia vespertilionis]WFD06446.1 hypothetical protein MVES1_001791 [Malassezia vespertilionis]
MPPARRERSALHVQGALAVAAVAIVGGLVWRWLSSREGQPRSAARQARRNPSLSVSFPMDAALVRALETDPALKASVELLFHTLAPLYTAYALFAAPTGHTLPLENVDALHILPYSTAEGRAMLARALQCQAHLELVFVCLDGDIQLGDGPAELHAYLGRLEQLARAVDSLHVALVPGPVPGANMRASAFVQAWEAHAVSKQANTALLRCATWDDLAAEMAAQRAAWG